MHVPSEAELAAIAAAYLAVAQRTATVTPAEVSRWSLAARMPDLDLDHVGARFAVRAASRWNAAGRFDG